MTYSKEKLEKHNCLQGFMVNIKKCCKLDTQKNLYFFSLSMLTFNDVYGLRQIILSYGLFFETLLCVKVKYKVLFWTFHSKSYMKTPIYFLPIVSGVSIVNEAHLLLFSTSLTLCLSVNEPM